MIFHIVNSVKILIFIFLDSARDAERYSQHGLQEISHLCAFPLTFRIAFFFLLCLISQDLFVAQATVFLLSLSLLSLLGISFQPMISDYHLSLNDRTTYISIKMFSHELQPLISKSTHYIYWVFNNLLKIYIHKWNSLHALCFSIIVKETFNTLMPKTLFHSCLLVFHKYSIYEPY